MKSPPSSPRADRGHCSLRWGLGVALLALTPKCLVCVAGYLGLGAWLGLKAPELCGASPSGVSAWMWSALGVVGVAVMALLWHRRDQQRSGNPRTPRV